MNEKSEELRTKSEEFTPRHCEIRSNLKGIVVELSPERA